MYFLPQLSYDGFITNTQQTRLQRLKEEPQGFKLENNGTQYSCTICHASISGENGWYDVHGEKCLSCQNAIENGTVPTFVCQDRESWYSSYELIKNFKITHSSISTMIRDGKLKSRKIKSISGSTNFEIFLKQENEILSSLKKN